MNDSTEDHWTLRRPEGGLIRSHEARQARKHREWADYLDTQRIICSQHHKVHGPDGCAESVRPVYEKP